MRVTRLVTGLELAAVSSAALARGILRRLLRGPVRPGWSVRTELVRAVMYATVMHSQRRGVRWLRDAQDLLPSTPPRSTQVAFEEVNAGGVPALWCTPSAHHESRTLVYFHGGGYVMGSVAGYRDLLGRLAAGSGARVLGIDYRLAPEHPFPAAQEDALRATRWVLDQGAEPRKLALAGDSAGGALSVATLCALRDLGLPLPTCALLFCPWTDPLATGGSLESNQDADFAHASVLTKWLELALAGASAEDPRLRVVNAELLGLPPLHIQVGGAELLLDQVRDFADRARDAGVSVDLQVYPEMFHIFQVQASLLPEGAAALQDAFAFLRAKFDAADRQGKRVAIPRA